MSFILYSNSVQTHPWYWREVDTVDLIYASAAITNRGILSLDCCACCYLPSRCDKSANLFALKDYSLLIQNGILTQEEYADAMKAFSGSLTQEMCSFPFYFLSSCLQYSPLGCVCCCLQRCESNKIKTSLWNATIAMNEKHKTKQVHWDLLYDKPDNIFRCCLAFNYWRLKATASLSYVAPNSPQITNPMTRGVGLTDSLKELNNLFSQGVLSEAEFVAAKAKLLEK